MKKKASFLTHLQRLMTDYFNTYLIIAVLSYALTAWTKDPMMVLKIHLLCVIPLYMYWIRQEVWNLFLFSVLHILPFSLLWFYQQDKDLIIALIVGVGIGIFVVYSFVLRLTETKNQITLGGLIVLCGALARGYFCVQIPQVGMGETLQPYLMTVSFVALLIYFMEMHLRNINTTLNNVNEMLNQPAQKIRKFNQKILAYFIIGTGIFIFLALVFRIDRGIMAIGQGLLWLIRFLIGLIPKGEYTGEESFFQENSMPDRQNDDMEFEEVGPSPFWEILEQIVTVAVVIALITAIVYGLYRFYKWFYSRKPETVTTDEFEETSLYIESEHKSSRKKESFWSRFRLTNEKKIRRIYRKRLEAPMKTQEVLKVSDSPKEILEKMPSEALEDLTELYEKARYSNVPITKEEVRKAESIS